MTSDKGYDMGKPGYEAQPAYGAGAGTAPEPGYQRAGSDITDLFGGDANKYLGALRESTRDYLHGDLVGGANAYSLLQANPFGLPLPGYEMLLSNYPEIAQMIQEEMKQQYVDKFQGKKDKQC